MKDIRVENLQNMTLYNCDCIDMFERIPDKSIDLILTDSPYELDIHGGTKNNDFGNRKLISEKHIDYICSGFDYDNVFHEFERVLKNMNMLIFCSNNQIGKIMSYWENKGYSTTLLVWDKPNPIPLCNGKHVSNLEFIIYVRGKNATWNNLGYSMSLKSYHYPAPKERIHDTEKPNDLLRQLLLIHSNIGDTILDPFGGSFSTAIACHDERRNFIGSEIDEVFFDKAYKRLRMHVRQLDLFK